jgi:hypothetical protein
VAPVKTATATGTLPPVETAAPAEEEPLLEEDDADELLPVPLDEPLLAPPDEPLPVPPLPLAVVPLPVAVDDVPVPPDDVPVLPPGDDVPLEDPDADDFALSPANTASRTSSAFSPLGSTASKWYSDESFAAK